MDSWRRNLCQIFDSHDFLTDICDLQSSNHVSHATNVHNLRPRPLGSRTAAASRKKHAVVAAGAHRRPCNAQETAGRGIISFRVAVDGFPDPWGKQRNPRAFSPVVCIFHFSCIIFDRFMLFAYPKLTFSSEKEFFLFLTFFFSAVELAPKQEGYVPPNFCFP